MDNLPWIEKYRPMTLNQLTQSDHIIKLFKNNIIAGAFTHYILYGQPGTGKTSAILAAGRELFKEHFSDRVIEFNASDDRGINAVRDKISSVAKLGASRIKCADGSYIPSFKLIILDEADAMTGDAQDALRVIIEKYSTVTRFCFICNYICKITNAIKSRCASIFFNALDKKSMNKILLKISKNESMKLSQDIIDTIIDISSGDMRKAIILLQNMKHRYDYIQSHNKYISNMNVTELQSMLSTNIKRPTEITVDDVYAISGSISTKYTTDILNKIISSKNNIDIMNISKNIHANGYPIDIVLEKLNFSIMNSKKISNDIKALIIHYNSNIFYNIIQNCDGYIQLMYYMINIKTIMNGTITIKDLVN